jgi:hypothetical protein
MGINDLFVMAEHDHALVTAIVPSLSISFSAKIDSSFIVLNYSNTEDKESLFVIGFMLVSMLRG